MSRYVSWSVTVARPLRYAMYEILYSRILPLAFVFIATASCRAWSAYSNCTAFVGHLRVPPSWGVKLVHGQVTIIFVVSVGLSVCLCRVFLSRV